MFECMCNIHTPSVWFPPTPEKKYTAHLLKLICCKQLPVAAEFPINMGDFSLWVWAIPYTSQFDNVQCEK